MKIYAIKDDNMSQDFILGYLIYYEISKTFYIELSDNLDPWDAPPLFFSFAERGQHSIDSYWSRIWVRQRIVPQDRQNIREILRDNRPCREERIRDKIRQAVMAKPQMHCFEKSEQITEKKRMVQIGG